MEVHVARLPGSDVLLKACTSSCWLTSALLKRLARREEKSWVQSIPPFFLLPSERQERSNGTGGGGTLEEGPELGQ